MYDEMEKESDSLCPALAPIELYDCIRNEERREREILRSENYRFVHCRRLQQFLSPHVQ